MPEPYEARDLSGAESGTGSGAVDASGKLSSGEDLLSSEGPRSPLRAVFVGREGLRAGWGALLFAVQLLAMSLLVQSVLRHVFHGRRPVPQGTLSPRLMLLNELVPALVVLLVTWTTARIERRRFGSFGLRDRAFFPRFLGGLAAGFAAISALVALLWVSHLLVLGRSGMAAGTLARYGLLWAGVFLLTGIFEESLFRGYLLFTLARGIGFPWAALLLAFAFGAIHGSNPGETPVGLFSAGAVGLVFCFSIWYTRSLAWAIGAHAAWDWGESFFWGTSDSGLVVFGHLLTEHPVGNALLSGGATGPEGSLLVFPVLLLLALGIYLWWRRGSRALRT